jgi:hypothetical protein
MTGSGGSGEVFAVTRAGQAGRHGIAAILLTRAPIAAPAALAWAAGCEVTPDRAA